jgi:hypothetical protein
MVGKDALEVYTGDRNWEIYDTEIRKLLSSSMWGFIFADPFSTELDIEKLICTIEAHKARKDILVFTNYRTLSRQSHRKHANDIERVCRSLGIKEEQINETADFLQLFGAALKQKFSLLKDFTIGVAIPVTVGGKLIKADYFYLVLATNSIVVADSFLIAYENAVTTERGSGSWGNLFAGDDILEIFSRRKVKILSLRELMEELWDSSLSWKDAVKGPGYEIPTIKHTVDKLNTLHVQNKLEFMKCELFQYKAARAGTVPGNLAYSKIKRGRDTEQIKIHLKK